MDDITKYLINCIVFPPKLPQNGDANKAGYEKHLIKLWLEGIQRWISLAGQADGNNEALRSFAQVTANIHATKHIVPEVLASALRNLQPGAGFATYIRKQNCGLLFHQQDANHVTLEMFEASAANTTIMSSSTMPLREFPGVALEIDADFLCCDQVREKLSQCLADLAAQPVERFIPLVRKARKEVSEVRNTPSPRAVTGALLSALLPYGRIDPVVSTIKKVRDEVCWNQALLPWRRPPLWTVLRVATQRWLETSVGSERGWHVYKNVQLIILTQLCVSVTASKSFGDELFYIRAKLARRLDKLRSLNELNSEVDKFARSSLEKCNRVMSFRWEQIINKDSRLIHRCQQTDNEDTTLWLKNSKTSIETKLAPVIVTEDSIYRGPPVCIARIDIIKDCHRLELFEFAPEGHDLFVSLYDFELQVEALNCEASTRNCRMIQRMFNRYEQAAARLYAFNADRESMRLLTLVELWVQLDQITLEIEPLVRLLDPALPKNFLSHLRLVDLKDLERVRKIEVYIDSRSKTSINKLLSPFIDHEMMEFANQYYIDVTAGARLRETHKCIDQDTAQLIKQKQDEWKRLKERCDELEREAAGLSHEQEWDQWSSWQCRSDCQLCDVKESISRITIEPFEEPLPRHERSARWALFELLCPEEFHIWRDVTWELGNDLGRQGESGFKPIKISCQLATYSGLTTYHSRRTTRLSLMSTKKSFSVAHYGKAQQVASVSIDKVCLPHGPEYSLYDSRSRVPTERLSSVIPILLRQYCGLLPQDERYVQSQNAIVGTQHTANDVVSSQSRCHHRMSPFEFHSFNILRSGEILQWLNIMIELACPSLEFAEDATNLLISQATLEIGILAIDNNILRMSHDWFSDSRFCTKLLHLLLNRVKQIRSNWKELTHLRALLVLILRLETLGSRLYDIGHESYQIRLLIREASCEWTRQLKREISHPHTAAKMSLLRSTKLSAALLCRATYTPADNLPDWGPYFECGFIVGNESPAVITDAPAQVRHYILQDWTNSCNVESRAVEASQAHPEQVSAAVGVLWADGERIKQWKSLDSPNSRWLRAQTEASLDRKQMQVHINVLTGEFLVEGKSPDRLPKSYLEHPQYREIFGSRQFEILPSPITGMIFTAKTIEGDFHFAWEKNDIQILRDNGDKGRELLLHRSIFAESLDTTQDLPNQLIRDQMHWLRLTEPEKGTVWILPRSRALAPPKQGDWALDFFSRRVFQGETILVEPNGSRASQLTEMIGCFESRYNLIVSVDQERRTHLFLPRFDLTLQLSADGQLCCPDLKGVIAEDQNVGVFVGLRGHLVMLDLETGSSFLIVPHGEVVISSHDQHIRASIHTGENDSVAFSKFALNDCLRRLDCNAECKDMLYKAYLHAVTSGSVPDPFTGRRGTDEALEVLEELYRQLFKPLDLDSRDLLDRLAGLTPTRTYYPEGLRVMQRSRWHPALPSTSQVDQFRDLVAKIIQRSNMLNQFHEAAGGTDLELNHEGSSELHVRSKNRNSAWFILPSDLPIGTKYAGTDYRDREHTYADDCLQRAYEIALFVQAWTPNIQSTHDLGTRLSSYEDLGCFNKDFEPMSAASLFSLEVKPIIGSFIYMCSKAEKGKDQVPFSFLFPLLAFSEDSDMLLLRSILSIAFNFGCHDIQPPPWTVYENFYVQEQLTYDWLYDTLLGADTDPNAPSVCRRHHESWQSYHSRQQSIIDKHRNVVKAEAQSAAKFMLQQWPCQYPQAIPSLYSRIDCSVASYAVEKRWSRLWKNLKLSEYLAKLSSVIGEGKDAISTRLPMFPRLICGNRRKINQSNRDLLLRALEAGSTIQEPSTGAVADRLPAEIEDIGKDRPGTANIEQVGRDSLHAQQALENILTDARINHGGVRSAFSSKLQESLRFLCSTSHSQPLIGEGVLKASDGLIQVYIDRAKLQVELAVSGLHTLARSYPRFEHLQLGGLWPRMTIADMLQLLSKISQGKADSPVRKRLVELALLVIRHQQLQRILRFYQQDDKVRLMNEINSSAHTWDTEKYAIWLILEIEMDVCIRQEQAETALHMAIPETGVNTVYQLQMGKGKSSLIIPMLAAILPQEDCLFRVIVTRPLLHQMGSILKQRLCRLLQRPLLHLPFSRATRKDQRSLSMYQSLHEEAMNAYGAVLVLPEHIQSLQLSGIQCLLDQNLDAGWSLIKSYRWITERARDVLDECDHILAPRTQLIYPSGCQSLVDGGARRWEKIALALRYVFLHVEEYKRRNPESLDIEAHRPSGFPFIFLHSDQEGQNFVDYIVEQMTDVETSCLPLTRLGPEEVAIVRDCLKNEALSKSTMQMIQNRFQDVAAVNDFLLLRGLLGGGVLLLTLQKRWNVQYGLHLERCQMAVPYLARGKPSPASEYGHPDVALTLTYLSYYHQGLRQDQLNLAIEKLRLEHDPSLEWDNWARSGHNLPNELCSWNSVNTDDETLMFTLWECLHFALPTINYYLDRVVFPRSAREFERKLISSSWDIPLQIPQLTTGFSGTNDNALLMPDSIRPEDLPFQTQTNAEVLQYLLRSRNREYLVVADDSRRAPSAECILDSLSSMEVDVLLDAGALILEMENFQVASEWLRRRADAKAAVYFNEDGVLHVKHRNGRDEPLNKSRYALNLTKCLLYLDEEHCRGTDTKLPAEAKAALTIGPRQPKDQTVQAAMRMRQLAHGQSLVFLAPPVVDKSIREFCGLLSTDTVDSRHVVCWSIEQSCVHIESHISLWRSQKCSHQSRRLLTDAVYRLDGGSQVKAVERVPEIEKHSLYELYGPGVPSKNYEVIYNVDEAAGQTLDIACAEEEQERQVDQEVQEEQQREKPEPKQPYEHHFHSHVRDLVLHGILHTDTLAYRSAFTHMAQNKALSDLISNSVVRLKETSRVLVTEDFCCTVETPEKHGTYQTLRPVRFVVWTRLQPDYLLIISPFEAKKLIPDVRTSVSSYILLYEAPRTRKMSEDFDDLDFFGIPRLPKSGEISRQLQHELFLYAGGLFFPYRWAKDLRQYLRLLNKTIDPQNVTRSSTDIGKKIAEVWRLWIESRLYGIDGLTSPAGLLIQDRSLDPKDRMFSI